MGSSYYIGIVNGHDMQVIGAAQVSELTVSRMYRSGRDLARIKELGAIYVPGDILVYRLAMALGSNLPVQDRPRLTQLITSIGPVGPKTFGAVTYETPPAALSKLQLAEGQRRLAQLQTHVSRLFRGPSG